MLIDFTLDFFRNFCIVVTVIHVLEIILRAQLKSQNFRTIRNTALIGAVLAGWLSILFGVPLGTEVFDLRHVPIIAVAMYFPGSWLILLVAVAVAAARFTHGLDFMALSAATSLVVVGLVFVFVSKWVSQLLLHRLWRAVLLISLALFLNALLILLLRGVEPGTYRLEVLRVHYPLAMLFGVLVIFIIHEMELALGNVSSLMDAAFRDPLTGLYNRRHLTRHLSALQARTAADAATFSVAYLDIDHFKTINDAYGHDQGDFVIREVARTIQQRVRPGDYVARVGGEEYLIVLQECPPAQAIAILERVRQAVEWHAVPPLEKGRVKISAGIASGPMLNDALMKDADTALYQAKQQGRNQVVHATAQEPAAIVEGRDRGRVFRSRAEDAKA